MRRAPASPPDRRPDVPGRAPLWRRRVHRHRVAIAAVLLGALVWSLTSALRPPAPELADVLVAARDLAPGTVLADGDLVVAQLPEQAVPRDAPASAASLVGRRVVLPLLQGDAVLDRHLLGSSLLAGYGDDVVATPVRLSDDAAAAVVRPGDVVDVVAATTGDPTDGGSSAAVVASGVRVLLSGTSASTGDGGLLAAPSSGGSPSVLVLATSSAQGIAIARAAVGARLSVMVRGA